MNSLSALLLPAILLAVPDQAAVSPPEVGTALMPPVDDSEPMAAMPLMSDVWEDLAPSYRPYEQGQVRVERRVIIRINPRRAAVAPDLLSALPQGEQSVRFKERKFGKCVQARSIAGVQAQKDNRLLLFLRDRRVLTVSLEKSCRARDFYSGFYIEPNSDGMICTGEDKLHSRSGASCELQKFRQLVVDR